MRERHLAVIDVKPGSAMESQSGVQMQWPRIYGAFEEPAGPKKTACVVMHPTSNFMGHYLISPLSKRGICCLGLNSRYADNDTALLMERVIQDLGAGVNFLRRLGYERIFLIGLTVATASRHGFGEGFVNCGARRRNRKIWRS